MSTVRLSTKSTQIPTFLDGESVSSHRWRDQPPMEFISQMRSQFPTEREYDHMLTRKLERRRSGVRHEPVTLKQMRTHLERFLAAHIEGEFSVHDDRWLLGGASKLQFGFTLRQGHAPGATAETKLVIRMEPTESLNATSRVREFQLLKAMAGAVPVPATYWVDADGTWFPEPVLIYAFASGTTKPKLAKHRVSGTGLNFGPELRPVLAQQFVDHLAAIHVFDWSKSGLEAFDVPSPGTNESALWQLNRARRVWEEDRGEDLPFMEITANWLEDNLPRLDRPSVVHGDFRAGNFLFDEKSEKITAWLDWERGYIGDRHRDLAWTTTRSFGHLAEDGKTFLVSGLVPVEEFYERYEQASGLTVDPQALQYYRIFNAYQLVVSNLASTYRVSKNARSHQDVLLAWSHGVSYPLAHELLTALKGAF